MRKREGPDRGCRSGLSLFYLLITSFSSLRRPGDGDIAEEVRQDITERLLSCFAGCRFKPCRKFRIEDVALQLGDETVRIFLSTCGKLDDISKDLKAFLKYVEHSTDEVAERSESELVKAVNRRVQRIKDTREYQVEYMTLYLHEKEIERKAYAEGVETGQEKGREQALKTAALRMYARGRNVEEIAGDLGISREQAAAWIRET